MKFYTNVHQVGDHVLVRGYENGQRFDDRIEYHEPRDYKYIDSLVNNIKPNRIAISLFNNVLR